MFQKQFFVQEPNLANSHHLSLLPSHKPPPSSQAHRRLWGIFKHQTQGTPGTWPGIMETMPPSATIDLCGTQCLSNTNSVSWWLWVCEVFWIEEQQLCICSADIWPLIKFDISQGLRNWNRKSEIETHFKNSWGDINLIIMSPYSHTTYKTQ